MEATQEKVLATQLANATKAEYLAKERPFKGRYQTVLFDAPNPQTGQTEKHLLLPAAYEELLQFGGVVTVGADEHLLLFSAAHWQHIVGTLARELGTSLAGGNTAVLRNIYGRHVEFDALNDEGNNAKSITLNKDLINFAKLTDKVVLVGLIYYAEIHREDHYQGALLSPHDLKQLAAALDF